MSKNNGVLAAFIRLIGGLFQVAANKLVQPEYYYRIVVYRKGESPLVTREIRTSNETLARSAVTKEFSWREADRAVLERFTSGRWVSIAEAPDPGELESFGKGKIDLDSRG